MNSSKGARITRQEPRLALLRSLSDGVRGSGPWKGVTSFLESRGDLDYAANWNSWNEVQSVFNRWALEYEYRILPPCTHRYGALFLLAIESSGSVAQLDVRSAVTFRGAHLFRAEQLEPLMSDDQFGFSVARPGSQAAFNMVLKCIQIDGTLDRAATKARGVARGFTDDWQGVQQAAALNRWTKSTVLSAARTLVEDRWDIEEGKRLRNRFVTAALTDPLAVVRQIGKRRQERACPLQKALASGQGIIDPHGLESDMIIHHAGGSE